MPGQQRIVRLRSKDRIEWESLVKKTGWWMVWGSIISGVLVIALMFFGLAFLNREGPTYYIPPVLAIIVAAFPVLRYTKLKGRITNKSKELKKRYGVGEKEKCVFQ